jgi:type 1 glutamine amidotransferase
MEMTPRFSKGAVKRPWGIIMNKPASFSTSSEKRFSNFRRLLRRSAFLLVALFPGATSPATRAAEPMRIVFMIGEEDYHTGETLPAFAETDLKPLGYQIAIINADAQDKNNFPGIVAALRDADLLFLSVRRRTPPRDQLDAVRAFLANGKPLVGIRTACHAFALRPADKIADPKLASWQEFDSEVIGGHYTGHLGTEKVTISLAPGAETQPILKGIAAARLIGNGGLYKVSPLADDTVPLLIGAIAGQPAEPVAWTHRYGPKQGRVFYTSLGHPDDFQNPEFRRFLVNAVVWGLGK